MYLVQLLVPPIGRSSANGDDAVARTRAELLEAFGGLTAYQRAPARGVWRAPQGDLEIDDVVMIEVVTPVFDRGWWRAYTARLRKRFDQEAIHARAMHVELLDEEAQ